MISLVLDGILLGVVVEALILLAYRRLTGGGVAPRALLANLGAGGSLMLALRLALDSAVAEPRIAAAIALCLTVAAVAHVADLASRWERGSALFQASRARS